MKYDVIDDYDDVYASPLERNSWTTKDLRVMPVDAGHLTWTQERFRIECIERNNCTIRDLNCLTCSVL